MQVRKLTSMCSIRYKRRKEGREGWRKEKKERKEKKGRKERKKGKEEKEGREGYFIEKEILLYHYSKLIFIKSSLKNELEPFRFS